MPIQKLGKRVNYGVAKAVAEVKAGKMILKYYKNRYCSAAIGKRIFSEDKIQENAKRYLSKRIISIKAQRCKRCLYIKKFYLSSTMSP